MEGSKGGLPLTMSPRREILENLDDNRSATVLTAIDFSKAFNRVTYQACLQQFAKHGSSTEVLKLLEVFLCGRTMSVRVKNDYHHYYRSLEAALRVVSWMSFLLNID